MKAYCLAAALLTSGAAVAETAVNPFTGGNVEAGAAKAAVCAACHGPGGNSSNPEWPKLAGQNATYVFNQLREFKAGKRNSPLMNPQAAPLSEQDMRDLAAYFAAQKPQPGLASADAVETAGLLYRVGDAARGLPACSACHGPEGAGNAAAGYPRIGGQHAKYGALALRTLRGAAAGALPPSRAMMATVAAKLTDAEIEALASYINGLQ